MASRRSSMHLTRLLIALAVFPISAGAATLVQRGPDTAPGTVQTVLGSGLQSLNLDGTPFVSAGGVTIVSKSEANDGDGVIRVFSEVDSRGVAGIPDALIGNALGHGNFVAVRSQRFQSCRRVRSEGCERIDTRKRKGPPRNGLHRSGKKPHRPLWQSTLWDRHAQLPSH